MQPADTAVAEEQIDITPSRLALGGVIAIAAAIVANLTIYAVSTALGAVPDDLPLRVQHSLGFLRSPSLVH